MPSHLTRNVFRRILANEPILHRGCLRRQAHRSFLHSAHNVRSLARCYGLSIIQLQQRRNLFNFNIFSKKQEAKEADIDPGIEKMMELAKRERMSARLPPPEEIAEAFERFFHAKWKRSKLREAITDTQAQLALQSLRYLVANEQEQKEKLGQDRYSSPMPRLDHAAAVLRCDSEPVSPAHVELARLIFDRSERFRDLKYNLITYVVVLTRAGASHTARDLLLEHERLVLSGAIGPESSPKSKGMEEDEAAEEDVQDHDVVAPKTQYLGPLPRSFREVLGGFAREGNEAEVRRTLAMMRERSFDSHIVTIALMLDFSLKHGDPESVKEWWKRYQRHDGELLYNDVMDDNYTLKILRWCLEHNELEMGHGIVRELMTSNPPKPMWDATLVWAAGTKKSVDEIGRMMTIMEKSNANISDRKQWRVPDIATINRLVEFAISKHDPYMAERFIALGRDRNIEPDAETLVLQMEYRLGVNDVDGALIAYKNLQAMDVSSNEDVLTVNRLIVALCQTNRHDFDTIMNVAADLSDRRVRFDPQTVSSLSILHFKRNEPDDVIDLLNTHAFHYSSTERQSIRSAIIAFCLDPKTPTSQAWQSYTILKSIFDEMSRSERTELMTSFLTTRERSDMGVHIFQNMRMHTRADTIPTIDTYVAAFMGIAKLRELESLEVVHNLLKLDYNINTTTYLYNSLMIAYTACGKPRTALDFWDDVVASREGPSYNSIHAALRACEKSHFGDLRAQEIWSMLRKRNVELDQALWASYVAALAGNGDVALAISTLEEGLEKGEVRVDGFVVGSLREGVKGQKVKEGEVEKWGRERFPEVWREVEELEKGNGIDRRLGP